MSKKSQEPESLADLAAWAKALAVAVTPAELARLVKDYRMQARVRSMATRSTDILETCRGNK